MATNSRTLSAGAISEETFYAAFEDVEPIEICSARDAVAMLEEIRNTISDPNNEWDKRNEALRKLRSLVLSGIADYDGVDFCNELRSFEVPFQATVKDLRSQVVREACITIGYLSEKLRQKFDHFAETVMHALLNLIKNSAKIMSTSGLVACQFIIKNTHAPKLIPIITSHLNSKSKEIRRAACELLWHILRDWPMSILDKNISLLQSSIKQGLFDADGEARALARKAYWAFAENFREPADSLFQTLDASKQRHLKGELSQSSSSSSLAAAAGAGGSSFGAFRAVRQSQENLRIARSHAAAAPSGSSFIPRSQFGTPGGRSTSDIDTSAAKRAVLRHHGGIPQSGGHRSTTSTAPRFSSSAAAQKQQQQLNSLPSKSATLGRKYVKQRSLGPPPSSSSHYFSISNVTNATYCSPVLEERPTRRSTSSAISLPGSRSNSPSRIAVPTSSSRRSGGGGRVPLSVAAPVQQHYFPVTMSSRDYSPTRQNGAGGSGYNRRSSEGTRFNNGLNLSVSRDLPDASFLTEFGSAGRRNGREKSEDLDSSETSSVCSGDRGALIDWELQETLKKCSSAQWSERKEALLTLQQYFTPGRKFSRLELKRICDLFSRMFVDSQHKCFTVFLDVLNDFILNIHHDLNEWLYVLIVRLFGRLSSEQLASVQSKLHRTLDLIRENFPAKLQFDTLVKYLSDPAQSPGSKTKSVLLSYFNELVHSLEPNVFENRLDIKHAVYRLVEWTGDPKVPEVRRQSQNLLMSLFNLNTPEFNKIICTFSNSQQERIQRLLHAKLMKQTGSVEQKISSFNNNNNSPLDMDYVRRSLRKTSEEICNYTGRVQSQGTPLAAQDAHVTSGSHDSGIVDFVDNYAKGDVEATPVSKMMELLSLNTEYEAQEEIISGILTEMSNHNRRSAERRKAMATLKAMTRDGSITLWDEHFKSVLLILLETLGDSDHEVRVQALRTLQEICLCQASRFKDYAELTLLKVLEAHKDPERDVCKAADECAVVLSTHLSPKVCLRLFCPLIKSDDAAMLAPALKMTTKVVEQLREDDSKDFILQIAPDLIDNVIKCYDHKESCIRKASVLCLVALNNCMGEKNLEPYLAKLSSNKIKLFHMYIKKAQSPQPL